MSLFLRLLLLACVLASADAAATARDDGFDARAYSLVTTRGTPVRVTLWSPPGPPVLATAPAKAQVARLPSPLPLRRPQPPTLPDPDPAPQPGPIIRVVVQPLHGSVQLAGSVLVYTPAPGYSGRDRLTYSLTGNGRTTTAMVSIDVGDPLRLIGEVVDRGVGAQVTAIVGSHTFRTQADAHGRYAIDVIGRSGDMAGIEARSGEVVLGSLLGGFARLRAEAGSDAVLSREENHQVQVSGVSTALGQLLQRANGGRPVVSDPTLQRLLGLYDAGTLLDMAAVIRLVADGGQPLPAGIADTRALIADAVAFEAFLETLPAELLYQVVDALVEDPALLAPVRAADASGARTFLSPSIDGELRLGLVQGWRMVLDADGAARFHTPYPLADDAATWTLADGVLQLRPHGRPMLSTSSYWIDERSVPAVSELEGLDLRLLLRGGTSGRDLYAVTSRTRTRFPDNPEVPEQTHSGRSAMLLHFDGAGDLPFRAAEIPGLRALPRHGRTAPHDLGDLGHGTGYALHRFEADGTGSVPGESAAFTWALDAEGVLAMAFADGSQVRVRRLLRDPRKGDGVLATFRLPDGRVKSKFDLSAAVDGSLGFTTGGLAWAWQTAFDITAPKYDAWSDFHVLLDGPAQTGHTRSRWPGNPPRDSPLSWELEGGRMVARHYYDRSGPVTACTLGVNGCFVRAERRWMPLAASGDRIYVSEELWTDPDWDGPLAPVMTSQRGNFYQRVVPPGP